MPQKKTPFFFLLIILLYVGHKGVTLWSSNMDRVETRRFNVTDDREVDPNFNSCEPKRGLERVNDPLEPV